MILVATDVAARGLDVDDIDVIIHQSSTDVDSFIHRSGRTGRAGKKGRNIVLYCDDDDQIDLNFFRKLEQNLKCSFKYTNLMQEEKQKGENVKFHEHEEKRVIDVYSKI